MEESPEKSVPVIRRREVTPLQDTAMNNASSGGTPSGNEMAKRGILRPSGTPGSGNGGESISEYYCESEAE